MTPAQAAAALPRILYRKSEVAKACGISTRTLDRLRSSGQFPRPDVSTGGLRLWRRDTIERYIGKEARGENR
jgi:predicted DNA-binding transcriptional regulator AlpA